MKFEQVRSKTQVALLFHPCCRKTVGSCNMSIRSAKADTQMRVHEELIRKPAHGPVGMGIENPVLKISVVVGNACCKPDLVMSLGKRQSRSQQRKAKY